MKEGKKQYTHIHITIFFLIFLWCKVTNSFFYMKESVFIDYGCSIFLQELDAVQQQGEDSVSALKKAISNGDTDTVKQLLDNGKHLLHFFCITHYSCL